MSIDKKVATVRCNECMGYFAEEDLLFEPDKTDGEYTHTCPNCHTDTMLMDLEPKDVEAAAIDRWNRGAEK